MKVRRYCRRHDAWHTIHGYHLCRHVACETGRRDPVRRDRAHAAQTRETVARDAAEARWAPRRFRTAMRRAITGAARAARWAVIRSQRRERIA